MMRTKRQSTTKLYPPRQIPTSSQTRPRTSQRSLSSRPLSLNTSSLRWRTSIPRASSSPPKILLTSRRGLQGTRSTPRATPPSTSTPSPSTTRRVYPTLWCFRRRTSTSCWTLNRFSLLNRVTTTLLRERRVKRMEVALWCTSTRSHCRMTALRRSRRTTSTRSALSTGQASKRTAMRCSSFRLSWGLLTLAASTPTLFSRGPLLPRFWSEARRRRKWSSKRGK